MDYDLVKAWFFTCYQHAQSLFLVASLIIPGLIVTLAWYNSESVHVSHACRYT